MSKTIHVTSPSHPEGVTFAVQTAFDVLGIDLNKSYADNLETRIKKCGNPVCFGMDPVLNLMRGAKGDHIEDTHIKYFMNILEEFKKRNVFPAVVKPNIAYWEGNEWQMKALQELVFAYQKEGIYVILDGKRGDIGKSSERYCHAMYGGFHAQAATVNPYMGTDSVMPFLETRKSEPNGVYVLLRTSNKGAADFQDLKLEDGRKMYMAVAEKMLEWDNGNLGAVVGATNPTELALIARYFVRHNKEIPFLIPGVSIPGTPGGQGGDAKEVMQALRDGGFKRNIHVINSSSGLSYAWQAGGNAENYASACADALEKLIEAVS